MGVFHVPGMNALPCNAVSPGQVAHMKEDLQDKCLLLCCSRHSLWHVL